MGNVGAYLFEHATENFGGQSPGSQREPAMWKAMEVVPVNRPNIGVH